MEVMKWLLILIILPAGSFYSTAQNVKKTTSAAIMWERASHDFGDVLQGDKV